MEQAYRSSSAEAALVSKLASQKSNRLLKNTGSFFTRFKEAKSIFPAKLTAAFDENGRRTKETTPEIFLFDKQPYYRKAQRIMEAIERAANSKEPDWAEIGAQAALLFKKKATIFPSLIKKPKYRHEAHEAIGLLAHGLYNQGKTAMNDVRMKLLGILARSYAEKVQSNQAGFFHDIVNWGKNMHHYKDCNNGAIELAEELGKKLEGPVKEEALKLVDSLRKK